MGDDLIFINWLMMRIRYVPLLPFASVNVTVFCVLNLLFVVLPVISPVVVFKLNPGGRGGLMENVYGLIAFSDILITFASAF